MKPIVYDQRIQDEILKDFKKFLTENRTSNNKISYTYVVKEMFKNENIKMPTVVFTAEAWLKIQTLMNNTGDEIGWHGIVKRIENNTFIITDILVYPQVVSGSNITTDQEKYQNWLMAQPDEIFNNIRYQGHSHVYFKADPSATDWYLYERILQTLRKTDYYIFMIINKRQELFMMIYDMAQNVVFEKGDISVTVALHNNTSLTAWHNEQTKLVTKNNIITTYSSSYGVGQTTQIGFNDKKKLITTGKNTGAGKGKRKKPNVRKLEQEFNKDALETIEQQYRREYFEVYGTYPDDAFEASTTLRPSMTVAPGNKREDEY